MPKEDKNKNKHSTGMTLPSLPTVLIAFILSATILIVINKRYINFNSDYLTLIFLVIAVIIFVMVITPLSEIISAYIGNYNTFVNFKLHNPEIIAIIITLLVFLIILIILPFVLTPIEANNNSLSNSFIKITDPTNNQSVPQSYIVRGIYSNSSGSNVYLIINSPDGNYAVEKPKTSNGTWKCRIKLGEGIYFSNSYVIYALITNESLKTGQYGNHFPISIDNKYIDKITVFKDY